MTGPQWQTITHKNGSAGVIALDAEGGILQANPKGQSYLELLAKVGLKDVLALMKDRPPVEPVGGLTTTNLDYELVLEGPPCRILQVSPQSVTADSRLEGWIVTIREVNTGRKSGHNGRRRGGRSASIFHWPPATPRTSNLP
jgi:hypothetical protein